jgi:DeoR/GlpR family transcriptional regulator of sugar metabolism
MSGSTTNLEIAKIIPSHISVTIFTYSLPIALELTHHPEIDVYFIGGKVNKLAQVSVGIDVVNFISSVRADICFIGTGGISAKKGMTEPGWDVSHIKKKMVDVSDYVVSICVSPKLMEVRKFSVVPIDAIDAMITDLDCEDAVFDQFKEKGLTII